MLSKFTNAIYERTKRCINFKIVYHSLMLTFNIKKPQNLHNFNTAISLMRAGTTPSRNYVIR